MNFTLDLLVLTLTALVGGMVAKVFKFHIIIGYLLIGLALKMFFPQGFFRVEEVAILGLILLLFTTGVELNLSKLKRNLTKASIGALSQVVICSLVFVIVFYLLHIPVMAAIILAVGFSLSSTALVLKVFLDSGEADTTLTEITIGWLIVQDLIVIVVLLLLNISPSDGVNLISSLMQLGRASIVIASIFIIGKLIIPKIYSLVDEYNSRELFILLTVVLGIGLSYVVSLFGISATIGAFIAGIIMSESLEKHIIISEIRPIRDIFVGVFFVSLGFMVHPQYIWKVLPLALVLALMLMAIKLLITTILSLFLKIHVRVAVSIGVSLSQVGEFSFLLFSLAGLKGYLDEQYLTLGIVTTILTLIIFPFAYNKKDLIYKYILKIVRKGLRGTKYEDVSDTEEQLNDHVIICGFGRVGKWVGKMIESLNIPYIVVDYNRNIVNELNSKGIKVLYGDPSEKEILETAGIKHAKLMILTIPDGKIKEEIIALSQTINPEIRIITRAHSDDEALRLKTLKVDKIIQPEFEASIATISYLLRTLGKDKNEIKHQIRSLRSSHKI